MTRPMTQQERAEALENAPTWMWDALLDATCSGMGAGFEAGYAAGRAAGINEAEASFGWAAAARVARTVAADRSRTWAPVGRPQRKGVA